eukprot:CAMPEP_0175104234 /NCGR_PEP_ID=MMETSP0086_2-20121207/9594_1 /TAXON_ID=136419 /ORGANISM="Unknown Unknown, Strain D1" /LENGTH=61 /DNA_ID=CAMNT_0016379563 /DNA_START=236 /DNA_END=421 /DNA_ORIENTATION=+
MSETHSDVLFVKADVDDLADTAAEVGISSMPTFHFVKNFDLVAQFSGADADAIEKLVNEHK